MSSEIDKTGALSPENDAAPKPQVLVNNQDEDVKVKDLDEGALRAAEFWATPKVASHTGTDHNPIAQEQNRGHKSATPSLSSGSPQASNLAKAALSAERLAANGAGQATLEQIGLSFIQEQRSARRWKIIFRFIWIALIVWFLYKLTSESPASGPALSAEHTAVVSIEDVIASDSMASSQYVVPALQSAFESSSAKAVVLLINSPGGSPVQAGIIYDEVKRLKEKHKKPVYAVVQESATSAAYYIAVAADDIYVNKASIVGSIGVLMDGFGATELMKKIGVERRLLTAGENKGILDPFSPQKPEDVAYANKLLDQIHQQFIAVVREGRKGRLKESNDTFSGLFWSGEEAIGLGLVDKLGSLEFVARDVVKAEEIVNYSYEEGVAERLVKRFGAAIGTAVVQSATPGLKVQ